MGPHFYLLQLAGKLFYPSFRAMYSLENQHNALSGGKAKPMKIICRMQFLGKFASEWAGAH